MGLIIFSIILVVLLFIGLGFKMKVTPPTREYEDPKYDVVWKKNKLQFLALLGLLLILPAIITKVPANSVGIKYSPFTGTSELTVAEGYHFKNPLDKIYTIGTQVQTKKIKKITSQTLDSQFVTTTLDVKYSVNPGDAYIVFKQFKTIDNLSESLIKSTVQRTLELITTNYDVMEILGAKRSDVYKELEADLKVELAKSGVTFYSISITDMDGGKEIENAIIAQAVAKKAVETADAELLKVQTEAKQKTVQAQADQDAASIKAETKIIQAKAEKEANELTSLSLTPEILQKVFYDKWDGKMPTYMGGDSGLMLNMDGVTSEK